MADEKKDLGEKATAGAVKPPMEFPVTDIAIFPAGGALVFHGTNSDDLACGQNTAKLNLFLAEDDKKDGLAKLKAVLAEMKISFEPTSRP